MLRSSRRWLSSSPRSSLDRYTDLLKRRPIVTKVCTALPLPCRMRRVRPSALPVLASSSQPVVPVPFLPPPQGVLHPPAARSARVPPRSAGRHVGRHLRRRRHRVPGARMPRRRVLGSRASAWRRVLSFPPRHTCLASCSFLLSFPLVVFFPGIHRIDVCPPAPQLIIEKREELDLRRIATFTALGGGLAGPTLHAW